MRSCTMEVQSPQSVQINFNNKIITLHNVTIVKNPKIITIDATQYSNFLKGSPVKLSNGTTATAPVKLQMPTLVPMNKVHASLHNVPFKLTSTPLNQTPVITQVPNLAPSQVIRTIQPKSGVLQIKPPSNFVPSSTAANSPMKIQAFPLKHQPTVIISPPKTSNLTPVKVQVKQPAPTLVIAKPPTPNNVPPSSAKVIISPPQKNKISPCAISPPEAKRPCRTLEFHCIFCKDIYEDSTELLEHLKAKHTEFLKTPKEEAGKPASPVEAQPDLPPEPAEPLKVSDAKPESMESDAEDDDDDDDDESEVNDLIMDLEDTQDTATSSQARTNTPESPEFEEHVPLSPTKPPTAKDEESGQDDLDYESFEYHSSIMEPICELSCENSNDGVRENEALRLYREAMEVNYLQNGIKKRGRRRQRKPKPLVENTTSLNGILAGLLESSSIRVPPGPGRGRRKEMNEEELELDRSNGVCLFSCNKCDETFKYAGDLAKHVRSHTISSPFQCSICQRKFTHIGSLNTHLRIHSGERPYKVS